MRCKNSTRQLLLYAIRGFIGGKVSYPDWIHHKHDILLALMRLNPTKPDDNTSNRIAYNVSGKDRMKLKTGRFLTRKMNLNHDFLNPNQIQQLADKINIDLFGATTQDIELVSGYKITEAYSDGIGGDSCMTGGCADYTKLYESNPDRFSMLIMYNGNNSARAIVHKLDNGRFMLDRVYGTSESLKMSMQAYARDKKWLWRVNFSMGTSRVKDGDNGVYDNNLCISGLEFTDGEIPYMDTLNYGTVCNNLLTIATQGDIELCNTNGELESGYSCSNCGDRVCEDEVCYADDGCYCQECYNDYYFSCEKCYETCSNDDCICIDESLYICRSCAENNYYYCEDCGDWFSEGVNIESENKTVCMSCLEGYFCCDDCSEYFSNDEYHSMDDGSYCSNCATDREDEDDDNSRKQDTQGRFVKCDASYTALLPFMENETNETE